MTKSGRGSGKSTDLPTWSAVGAILWKGRTAATWNEAASRMEHGRGKSLMTRWTRWIEDGTWGRVVDALADVRAIPVPEPSKEAPLPDILVEGEVSPNLLLGDTETAHRTGASSTTMSWQAAMTVSAMPGCPSRRVAPGLSSESTERLSLWVPRKCVSERSRSLSRQR